MWDADLFKTATFRCAILSACVVTVATTAVLTFGCWHVAKRDAARSPELMDEIARAVDRGLEYVTPLAGNHAAAGSLQTSFAVTPASGAVLSAPRCSIGTVCGRSPAPVTPGRADSRIRLLGQDFDVLDAFRRAAPRALALSLAPAILVALAMGAIFAVGAARRLKTLGRRIIRLAHGDLDERLPVRETRDELDRLASIVNTIVEETGRLVGPTESVSDAISNDLPTHLSAIRAKLAGGLATESEEHLRLAAENAIADIDQALATVSALSRIADIGRRRRTSGLAEVDLRQVCINAFERFQPLAEAKSVVFRLDAPETLPVRGDFDLLAEAVANLVDNAIIRTPAGGFVEIVARPLLGKPVIRVLDSEPGVGAFDHPGVPERFYSTEKGRRTPGRELGLSIAAAIAEMHGFALRVAYGRRGAQFEMSA